MDPNERIRATGSSSGETGVQDPKLTWEEKNIIWGAVLDNLGYLIPVGVAIDWIEDNHHLIKVDPKRISLYTAWLREVNKDDMDQLTLTPYRD